MIYSKANNLNVIFCISMHSNDSLPCTWHGTFLLSLWMEDHLYAKLSFRLSMLRTAASLEYLRIRIISMSYILQKYFLNHLENFCTFLLWNFKFECFSKWNNTTNKNNQPNKISRKWRRSLNSLSFFIFKASRCIFFSW